MAITVTRMDFKTALLTPENDSITSSLSCTYEFSVLYERRPYTYIDLIVNYIVFDRKSYYDTSICNVNPKSVTYMLFYSWAPSLGWLSR